MFSRSKESDANIGIIANVVYLWKPRLRLFDEPPWSSLIPQGKCVLKSVQLYITSLTIPWTTKVDWRNNKIYIPSSIRVYQQNIKMELLNFLTHRNSWHSTTSHCCTGFCHYWIVLYCTLFMYNFCTTECATPHQFQCSKSCRFKNSTFTLKDKKIFRPKKSHNGKQDNDAFIAETKWIEWRHQTWTNYPYGWDLSKVSMYFSTHMKQTNQLFLATLP